jgi:hypothetical protein
MSQASILYPMLALVGWTMTVLLVVGGRRLASGLHPREFKLGESAAVPPQVIVANRNFMNLLEVPVLFYVVCLMFYVSGQAGPGAVALAWTFVGLRVAHSAVHLSYNNVMHRFGLFALSNLALVGLWGWLLVRLA